MKELPIETTVYSMSAKAPVSRERRSDERHITLFRVGSLIAGGRRELCLVKNISAGGALIRPYCDLKPDEDVHIELREGQAVAGKINWVRDGEAGIEFDAPIDVVGLLAASGDGPRPRMPRIEVETTCLIRHGADVRRASVRNVSQGGVAIECEAEIAVGAEVTVTLAGLSPRLGVVRWARSGAFGITFNNVLGLPALVQWLHGQAAERESA